MRPTAFVASAAVLVFTLTCARGAELRCDSPGVAQGMIRDMFADNPSAKQRGLEVENVKLLDVRETGTGAVCLVSVRTNHGFSLRYNFRLSADGKAALDLAP